MTKYSYFVTYHLCIPVIITWQHRKYSFFLLDRYKLERNASVCGATSWLDPEYLLTCSQTWQVCTRHCPKNLLQHSGWVDHFRMASITWDVWEGPGGPTTAGSAWIKITGVFLQRLCRSFTSLFLLQPARVKQTILSSPSSLDGSEGSLLGNMAYLISAYRSRWAANACSKSFFFQTQNTA